MLIRGFCVMVLCCLLALVLYLPVRIPPQGFIAQIAKEHRANVAFWGQDRALLLLARALSAGRALAGGARSAAAPGAHDSAQVQRARPAGAAVDGIWRSLDSMTSGPYFLGMQNMMQLALYRLHCLLAGWAPLAVFIGAAVVDGLVRRRVKAAVFGSHNPELFGLSCFMVILIAGAVLIVSVLPLTLPPWLLPAVPGTIGLLAGAALSNYHRHL